MDRVSKKKNMKRLRGGRREETREINQKHWRANHHYLCLENHVFSTWRKVTAKGTFANDSNFAARMWLLGLELRTKTWTVTSTSFFIYLGQCSIFRLERNVLTISWSLLWNKRHKRGPTIQKSKTDRGRYSVPWARELITRYYSLHLHFLALMSFVMIIAIPSTWTPLGKCRNVPDFSTVNPSRWEK